MGGTYEVTIFGYRGSVTPTYNLAELYRTMGEYAKAEPLCQEAPRIRQKVLGAEHPDTAASLYTLGELYQVMGEYTKAESLYQEALRIWQKLLGKEHSDTAASLNNLALVYQAMGEYTKAEPIFRGHHPESQHAGVMYH